MTKEEAIKWLKVEASYIEEDVGHGKEILEAYDMAIKALEQQPCDCISRTELLSRIDAERKHLLDLKMDGAEHIVVHHARRIIEDIPSVTPQPKIGRWIKTYEPNDAEPFILWKCECCGLSERIKTHYCPNCGAKMIEPQTLAYADQNTMMPAT